MSRYAVSSEVLYSGISYDKRLQCPNTLSVTAQSREFIAGLQTPDTCESIIKSCIDLGFSYEVLLLVFRNCTEYGTDFRRTVEHIKEDLDCQRVDASAIRTSDVRGNNVIRPHL